MSNLGSFLPILLLVVAFYLLVLRPARNRTAQAKAIASSLEPGSRIMTTAGLYGTVTEVDGDEIMLEIADGVQVRYVAAAVAKVLEPGTLADADSSLPEDDTPST